MESVAGLSCPVACHPLHPSARGVALVRAVEIDPALGVDLVLGVGIGPAGVDLVLALAAENDLGVV